MNWSEFFGFGKQCRHDKVPIDSDIYYCPECGELIENQWYITRCSCCGLKHITVIKKGEIMPESDFCQNCGSKDYLVERIDKIDCININYAVLIKRVIDQNIKEYTQSWENTTQTTNYKQKLLK